MAFLKKKQPKLQYVKVKEQFWMVHFGLLKGKTERQDPADRPQANFEVVGSK